MSNVRPISNASNISKLLEQLVTFRLIAHLEPTGTIPAVQSAHHRYHSTKTALTKIVLDTVMAADPGFVSIVVILNISAAFDTVDHRIIFKRLQAIHHITDSSLN